MKKEWIMTDDGDTPQWVKQLDSTTFTVVEVEAILDEIYIKKNKINVAEFTIEEIENFISSYYGSLSEFKFLIKDMQEQNQLIAECVAEQITPFSSDSYHRLSANDVIQVLSEEYGIDWPNSEDWISNNFSE